VAPVLARLGVDHVFGRNARVRLPYDPLVSTIASLVYWTASAIGIKQTSSPMLSMGPSLKQTSRLCGRASGSRR
jgi:hypothetical protein